jgi:uncharacterized membrane protein
MVTLATVAILNAVFTFVLGVPLNALLLFWAIRRHTPNDLRPYARLLQQTCVTDMALLIVNVVLIPVNIYIVFLLITTHSGKGIQKLTPVLRKLEEIRNGVSHLFAF